MLRRLLLALLIAGSLAGSLVAACSGSERNPKYPRRRPGCDLAVYYGLPTGAWDDIGMAEVGCYLDESEITCLGRLRFEACRMGGNIIYNLPRKALRPIERGMIYRAMVAHTRDGQQPADDAGAPAPAPSDAAIGPVMPLPRADVPPAAPASPSADAGTH